MIRSLFSFVLICAFAPVIYAQSYSFRLEKGNERVLNSLASFDYELIEVFEREWDSAIHTFRTIDVYFKVFQPVTKEVHEWSVFLRLPDETQSQGEYKIHEAYFQDEHYTRYYFHEIEKSYREYVYRVLMDVSGVTITCPVSENMPKAYPGSVPHVFPKL